MKITIESKEFELLQRLRFQAENLMILMSEGNETKYVLERMQNSVEAIRKYEVENYKEV
jgi:hypothetical protein